MKHTFLQLRSRLHLTTELLLWFAAALSFSITAFAAVSALDAQRSADQIVPRNTDVSVAAPDLTRQPNAGEVIGRVEIPALGISVPITAGIETSSLLRGLGHVDGSARAGGLGTLALAGHRDTYLRPLQRVARGMDIRVIDATGIYHYSVDSTEIVMPEQVDVLAIRLRPELVLITCYPFHYVGAAPKRFIVHAHLLSAAPDAAVSIARER